MSDTTEHISEFSALALENIFENPTPDYPVRAQDLIKQLDLEFLRPILDEMYAEKYRFKFDPIPVFKAMIYWRLSGKRFLTEVFNDLLTDPTLANNLGFIDIPDYKQLYHFLNYRLGKDGVRKIFNAILAEIIRIGNEYDLKIGKELIIDSTPIEKKNMKQASYNPKYEMKCIKYHNLRCARTGLPLEYHASKGTEYDGNLFVPLIYRAITQHGIKPIRVFGDGHYTTAKDLMWLREYFGIEAICNIGKNWTLKDKATLKDLKAEYQKLWKLKDFKIDAKTDYIKWFMIQHDKTEVLENYYHNDMLKKYLKDPEGYLIRLKVRSAIEHGHGLEKKHTELKNIQASNLDTFETHLGMHVISRLALALVRLQHGITDKLINLGGVV